MIVAEAEKEGTGMEAGERELLELLNNKLYGR